MAGGLAEWLRYFNDLAVGETAAPAWFSRENAEGAEIPPLLSHEMTRHVDARVKRGGTPREHVPKNNFIIKVISFQCIFKFDRNAPRKPRPLGRGLRGAILNKIISLPGREALP